MTLRKQRQDRRPGPWDEPSRRVNKHGLTSADIAPMARAQGHRCLGCGGPLAEAQVDHDHELAARHPHPVSRGCALCVRGLLCRPCNSALGFAGDSPATLRTLADYVERSRARAAT